MLKEDDWLPQARKLAVGMRMRVRHGRERRANMTIGHERGHYWAYCQSCKEGGKMQKDHVLRMPAEALDSPATQTVPPDLRPVLGGPYEEPVARFLASKGMDMLMLPKLWHSESRRRLCLQDPSGGWHGRDLTDRSEAKWLHYSKPVLVGWALGRPHMIVTEDLFSMFKVMYACKGSQRLDGYGVASTLGAGLSVGAALALKNCRSIVWAYDGDKAGDAGYVQASKRMRVHSVRSLRARPPEGMDPKDMACASLRELIEGSLA